MIATRPYARGASKLFCHSIYLDSNRLLSTLPNQLKLVFGQTKKQSTLDFCPRPAKKEMNVKFGYSEKTAKIWPIFHLYIDAAKVRSSYGPLAYFSDIFISGKNVVISAER